MAFSPDGRWIASSSADGTAQVWDAASGRPMRTLEGHTASVGGVAFSPDGSRIATISLERHDGTVRVWDAASGRLICIAPTEQREPPPPTNVAFSPDGKRLAVPGADGTVNICDAATGQHVLTCRGRKNMVFAVAFSPDGKHLASGGNDQSIRLWDAATGQPIRSFPTYSGAILGVAFSPDGRRLVSSGGDRAVRVWDTVTRQELLTLHGHTQGVFAGAFSPDGRCLASASADGTVKVWDGTEVTPQGRIEWEARGLVQWLFAKSLSADEVVSAVRGDPTITDVVRQEALVWAERVRCNRLRAEAARLIRPLFRKPLLRSEVLDTLRADASLGGDVRKEALAMAQTFPEDAVMLNSACWALSAGRMPAPLPTSGRYA